MLGRIGRRHSPRAFHVAVVGSGPSAFYATKYLLRQSPTVHVDMIERLPTPFGLVRAGVAPDHSDTKTVTNDFQAVLADLRCRFFGNVELDRDVSIEELRAAYDAVIVACGAASERSLGIAGETTLANSVTARAFVNWYNGHPDHAADRYDFSVETAIVIGNGNVALDVTRVLCSGAEVFQHTDMTTAACEALRASRVRRVIVVGRRGAPQSSFTTKELREIVTKKSFPTFVSPEDLDPELMTPASVAECGSRAVRRKMQVLAQATPTTSFSENGLFFRFNRVPVAILPDAVRPNAVGSVVFEKTRLEGDAGNQVAIPTGEYETISAGLVVRSVGYSAIPIRGLPFDGVRGVIPSQSGRVLQSDGAILPGLYVTGWIKRGPSGIIGSNIADAQETISSLIADLTTAKNDEIRERLWRRENIVDKAMWEAIDADERERGLRLQKPREKHADRAALLAAARKPR